jgi:hypothetical protein
VPSPLSASPASTIALPDIAGSVATSAYSAIDSGHTASTAPPRDTVYTTPSLPRSIARASVMK